MTTRRTNTQLGPAGKALVKAIKSELGNTYELDERESAMLDLAAHQMDDVARLEADVKKRGTTVLGSQGQPVLNPSLAEARQGRLALGKLLGSIDLPDSAKATTSKARKAAEARWSKEAAK